MLLLFSAIALIIAILVAIRETTQNSANTHSATAVYRRDTAALIVSSDHYKRPPYAEVYDHTGSIGELNNYLQTLDPYSRYLGAEEAAFIEKRNRKNRTGIGLDFLVGRDKILAVPAREGPAYLAGLTAPAYLHSIDGRKIDYGDFNSYAFLTELPAGQVVQVTVEENGPRNTISYPIQVASYTNEPVAYVTHDRTLLIQIRKFAGGENSRLKRILESSKPFDKIAFDLRHSPGGDLYAMVDMLSFLLAENLDVVFLETADVKKELSLETLPDRIISDIPVYVLVSEFTASTAELFAWALRTHYPAIKILGEPTQGKCLAQNLFPFNDGSILRLTTHEVMSAAGQSCQGAPLVPDELVRGIALSDTRQIFDYLQAMSPSADEQSFMEPESR